MFWWRLLVLSITVISAGTINRLCSEIKCSLNVHVIARLCIFCSLIAFFCDSVCCYGKYYVNSCWHLFFCSVDSRAYNRVAGLKQMSRRQSQKQWNISVTESYIQKKKIVCDVSSAFPKWLWTHSEVYSINIDHGKCLKHFKFYNTLIYKCKTSFTENKLHFVHSVYLCFIRNTQGVRGGGVCQTSEECSIR